MCDYINAEARRKLIEWAAVCPDPDVRADGQRLEEALTEQPVRAPQGPHKPVSPDDRPGSHAVPPLDLNVIHRSDAPSLIGAAGDPEREWRVQGRALAAIWQNDTPVRLGNLNADDALDLYLAVSEFAAVYNRDRRVVAYAEKMISAGEAIREARKTPGSDRSEPLGRLIDVQPPSTATAGPRIARRKRDDLLRHVRGEVADWAAMSDHAAAAAMIARFKRYEAGAWQVDRRERETAPAPEPQATFWRLKRLPIKTQMLETTGLVKVLRGKA
ncbi:hypothetical protein ACEN2J_14460 [Pseudorhodobacter sp. W20_MBD10_FR17]|uniref:hypothetical protein n=1 Tax=Pseudorhodobacter sp. W20_MBD10_FR17 TaxID=3240266 RepID=UPI003F9D8BAD